MDLFNLSDFDDHEQVVFAHDAATGLKTIIAVHDTTLGPALGGCRIKQYDTLEAATVDALRLSRGMTYKAALADLPLGGGKSVLLADAATEKTPAMMRAMGRAIERLGGRYIVAEDIGATPADMDEIGRETAYVTGRSTGVGDPSPWTAKGVFLCLQGAVAHRLKRDLAGVRISVKGLGSVGAKLARLAAEARATLTLSDIREDVAATLATELGATVVSVDDAASAPTDVFAPCALGSELNSDTIEQLNASIICGAANNQLATAQDGARLAQKGVLYCPDYLVNAGGLISVARSALSLSEAEAERKLAQLPETLRRIIDMAQAEAIGTADVADRIAEERFRR